jgi:hypothetical protein
MLLRLLAFALAVAALIFTEFAQISESIAAAHFSLPGRSECG